MRLNIKFSAVSSHVMKIVWITHFYWSEENENRNKQKPFEYKKEERRKNVHNFTVSNFRWFVFNPEAKLSMIRRVVRACVFYVKNKIMAKPTINHSIPHCLTQIGSTIALNKWYAKKEETFNETKLVIAWSWEMLLSTFLFVITMWIFTFNRQQWNHLIFSFIFEANSLGECLIKYYLISLASVLCAVLFSL